MNLKYTKWHKDILNEPKITYMNLEYPKLH